jgi:nicotinamidase-related amidase
LVPSLQEAIFFHSIARQVQPDFYVKGDNPLTEHYSVLGPEVATGPDGEQIGSRNESFVDNLLKSDIVVVAGQAKSHCVAWTIGDLLEDIEIRDKRLAEKVYLLEDCTSPVVVPGGMDYTEEADAAFRRFERYGMKIVRSTDPMDQWPGIDL